MNVTLRHFLKIAEIFVVKFIHLLIPWLKLGLSYAEAGLKLG